MILDSRIKDGKRPLTCIDIEQARAFVGKIPMSRQTKPNCSYWKKMHF